MMGWHRTVFAILPLVLAALLPAPLRAADSTPLAKSRALITMAEERERAGAHDDALLDYTNAINLGALPRDEKSRALFARGLVLDQTGKLDAAAGDYSAALALAPGFATAMLMLSQNSCFMARTGC